MAVNRNFARTLETRVSHPPELHTSPICQFPGSPGIPPPAVLTSVVCNGFRRRLFSSFPPPSRFLFPLIYEIFFPCRLQSFSPLSFAGSFNFPNSSSPRNRGRRTRRVRQSEKTPKVPGRESPEQARFRGNSALNLSNRGKWGPFDPVTAPKYQKGRRIIAFEDLSTFGPHFFWTWQ